MKIVSDGMVVEFGDGAVVYFGAGFLRQHAADDVNQFLLSYDPSPVAEDAERVAHRYIV